MSNPVSLYVADEATCLAELSDDDVLGGERDPNLRDYLEGVDSDLYTMELSELFGAGSDALRYQPADRFLRIIFWSWLDDEPQVCDVEAARAEELGFDLAISPGTIEKLAPVIAGVDPAGVAAALFAPNDAWDTEEELAEYLGRWTSAFADALAGTKGLYYKIWV